MEEMTTEDANLYKSIFMVRGQRVMLDTHLAEVYDVETKVLNQAVKRNLMRFPPDFMFQLNSEEWENLKSQSVTSSWGGRRTLPFVFTEHGSVMLASVLNSAKAVDASICAVRAFVRIRTLLATHEELARKIKELEIKYDGQFEVLFQTLNEILNVNNVPRGKIGFST